MGRVKAKVSVVDRDIYVDGVRVGQLTALKPGHYEDVRHALERPNPDYYNGYYDGYEEARRTDRR